MSISLPNRSLFGRRLAVSVIAILLVALTATSVAAQPAPDTTVHPQQQSEVTLETAPAAPLFTEPLSPPAGNLDPSFDGDGIVTTGVFSPYNEQGQAVAIQNDGKIVVVGKAYIGSTNDFALVRYNSNGSLDTSFDVDGKVTTVFGSYNDNAKAVAIQSDGKVVVAGSTYTGSSYVFALARYNSNGSLDTSFDTDGKVTTAVTSYDEAYAVGIQSDGKIVVAGNAVSNFALVRYNSNGSLDTTFDSDGKVTTNFGDYSYANALAIQSNGKIVVTGKAAVIGNGYDFALARYNSNGSLDTTFDGDGKVTTPILSSDDEAYAVAIQSDGKIVVAGLTYSGSVANYYADFALARYTSTGSLDTSFDSDGKVTTAFGSLSDIAYAVAIQSDGKIVVAGRAYIGSTDDFVLARYNSNGTLDTSFDADGKVTTAIGSSYDGVYAMAIQSDGGIVVAGIARIGSTDDFALARYTSSGALDTSFDGDGNTTVAIRSSDDYAYAVAMQSDGKIVVAGSAISGSYNDFALARYNSNGSLDTSFDGDGKVTTSMVSVSDTATAVAIQSDGKIVAAGIAIIGSYEDFALARYNSNGSLDTSFDTDGKVTTAIGVSYDYIQAVAVQSDGKIIAAGGASNGSNGYDIALARYNSNGSLDTSFDTDGIILTPVGSGSAQDIANAMAVQNDGKIMVAGYATMVNEDFVLARYNSDGSLDTSFDTDGKVTTAIGSSNDRASAMAVQSDGKMVVAGYAYNVSNNDFALARYNSDGSLDTSFDSDGKVTTAIGSSDDIAYAVAIQSDGKIVVAGYAYNGSNNDFALARYNSDGSLDTSFDTDGKLITAIGNGYDRATAMSLQSNGMIVAAGIADVGSIDNDFAVARYQVASTSSQAIANNASATLEGVTITNRSGAACTLTITKYPVPPGGAPANNGEMPVHWQLSTNCTNYNFDLVFSYNNTEVLFGNNVNETNLQAYRSANGNDFSLVGGTVNTTANTVTVTGVTQLSWWALGNSAPTSVTLADFSAVQQGNAVLLTWETNSELENRGFNLYRGTSAAGPDRQLNATLIPSQSQGNPGGFIYTWEDRADLAPGATYFYWVEDVDISGATTMHGPVSVDFAPLAVTLAGFSAVQQGDMALVAWETASELDNLGFNLYRGVDPAGPDRQLNASLIPSQSPGSSGGYAYTWEDRADLVPGTSYFYWVEDVDTSGAATMHGPVSVDFTVPTAVHVTTLAASSPRAPAPLWSLALLAAVGSLALPRLARRRGEQR